MGILKVLGVKSLDFPMSWFSNVLVLQRLGSPYALILPMPWFVSSRVLTNQNEFIGIINDQGCERSLLLPFNHLKKY